MSLISELKRRDVFRVSGAYLALGWIAVQITATLAPAFHLPESALPLVTWICVIGFPFAVAFSWVFELTPEGLKRESEIDRSQPVPRVTSKRLDYIIIGMLAVAMLLFVADRFLPRDEAPPAVSSDPAQVESPVAGAGPARDADAAASPSLGRVQGTLPQEKQTPVAPDDKSIAVLPFADMSAGKDQEYMSDGIAEELLNLLAKIPELKVIARTSSFAFKGREANIAEIAQTLNVAHVLEGSVRKAGNTVRITVQLIRAADSTHLWSETYDRTLDDIFAVQDEIAATVVGKLRITLLGAAPKTRPVDPKAYPLFLQAREVARLFTAESFDESSALYRQSLAIDPGYVAAWTGLARNHINQAGLGLRPEENYRLAREALGQALAIDPEDALAHARLGYIAMAYDRDFATAARQLERALVLDPANLDILGNAATLAQNLGRLDQAIAIGEYKIAQDPLNSIGLANLAYNYRVAGRPDAAIPVLRTVLSLSPGYIGAQYSIGAALLQNGDAQGALVAMRQEPDEVSRLLGLALAQHALGNKTESDAALADLISKYGKDEATSIAMVLAFRGEVDLAFAWLDKAAESRAPWLHEVGVSRNFINLHDDRRWLPFLRKVGAAPEQLAAIRFDVRLPQPQPGQ